MNTVFYQTQTDHEALINPADFVQPVHNFPKVCISTFSKKMIDQFLSCNDAKIIANLCSANGMNPIYKVTYGGKEIALYLSLVGAPACVAGLEEVIAMGAEKFVFFGCCGVLDDEKVKRDLIIPTAAIRDEGTSYHYLPPSEEIKPEPKAEAVLKMCMEKCGYPYVTGKIWTTDAIYRETTYAIQQRKKEGCVGVDMEYSALLAAAKYRDISFLQFFYGADNLDSEVWESRDLTDYGLHHTDKYMALAFECALKI